MLYDSLTGLPNAVLLIDRLQQALAHAARHKQQIGLIYLDIDGFRQVVSTHGSGAGDVVLGELATRLRRCVLRQEDTVARLCGDQFVLILSNADGKGVRNVLDKVGAAMRERVAVGNTTMSLTVSMGASQFPQDGAEWSELLRFASMAMRCAKTAGGGRYVCYEDGVAKQEGRAPTGADALPVKARVPFWIGNDAAQKRAAGHTGLKTGSGSG